ncbi:hypothetical protein B0H15DRAFT_950394 [Mycena belliarum]|uniref:Uncharacterized protein n=1 Tax=Mycena belliarum TaxID=1033014 RepID=A0AAD6U617_9AGAR|nr:hypothetical protein B0H15DRAFT_950394 [Mycena belliae]
MPAPTTIRRTLIGLSKAEASATTVRGSDPDTAGFLLVDNCQNYHQVRDHRVGREPPLRPPTLPPLRPSPWPSPPSLPPSLPPPPLARSRNPAGAPVPDTTWPVTAHGTYARHSGCSDHPAHVLLVNIHNPVGTAAVAGPVVNAPAVFTAAPPGGFQVYGWDALSVRKGISARGLTMWDDIGLKAFVYAWNPKRHEKSDTTIEELKTSIARVLGGATPLVGPADPAPGTSATLGCTWKA